MYVYVYFSAALYSARAALCKTTRHDTIFYNRNTYGTLGVLRIHFAAQFEPSAKQCT